MVSFHARSDSKSRRMVTAPRKSPLLKTTPTLPLATPTTHGDRSQSDVISEVLDHTPSESVPEEVSEEATPTASQPATEYSSDTFASPDQTLTPHTLPTSQSHTLPVTSTPAALAEDEPLESTSGNFTLDNAMYCLY